MSRAWMPFYGGDFLGNTMHLSATEIGAYVLLLWHAWEHGGRVPNDNQKLARIARTHPPHWLRMRKSLESLFDTQDPASWISKRVILELTKNDEISNKRKAAAKQMHSKRSANGHANAEHMHPQSQSQSQRKKEYAFESGTIRLTEKDFGQWKDAYSYLDLKAELLGLSKWASEQGSNWYHAVSGALAKRNREAKERLAERPKFRTMSGMDGII